MTKWLLKCEKCGNEWMLDVSFDLEKIGRIYHYCKICRKNTFHKVLGRVN